MTVSSLSLITPILFSALVEFFVFQDLQGYKVGYPLLFQWCKVIKMPVVYVARHPKPYFSKGVSLESFFDASISPKSLPTCALS